jgi:hypothetical protein
LAAKSSKNEQERNIYLRDTIFYILLRVKYEKMALKKEEYKELVPLIW